MLKDVELIYQQWVKPFYMQFLHGNFRHRCQATEPSEERESLILSLHNAMSEITPSIVDCLFEQEEWRARLTGSWFCALKGWSQYREIIGQRLIESECCFAGQGYCAALASFEDPLSAGYLGEYLDIWLPQLDKFYDQHWAMPALIWIDERCATDISAKYLTPGGLWDCWAASWPATRDTGIYSLQSSKRRFYDTLQCGIDFFRC